MWTQRLRWYHPQWPVVLVALASWVLVALHSRPTTALGHAGAHHPHVMPHAQANDWLAAGGAWFLMITAMMLPSAMPAVRHVAMSGMWRRRSRNMAVFLAFYAAVWMLFGIAAIDVVRWLQVPQGPGWALAATLAAAAAWELSAFKRRALRSCHRPSRPLPPNGWPADFACARAGVLHGLSCLGACWALMLPMAVAGHSAIALMIVIAVLVNTQRWLALGVRLVGVSAAVLAVLAVLAVRATM